MKRNLTGKHLFGTGALIIILACGAGFASGWGGSSSGSSSGWGGSSSGSSSGWGGSSSGSSSGWGGSSNSQTPTCSTSNLALSLTKVDCLKCHPGVDAAQVTRHHLLIGVPPKNLSCLSCHQPALDGSQNIAFPVVRDCIVCHMPSVHDKVTHCVVYDSCGNCHKASLPDIHSGASSSGNRYSYHSGSYGGNSVNPGKSVCYLCHASTNSTVQQTVVKGLAGQTVACSNCHGGGR